MVDYDDYTNLRISEKPPINTLWAGVEQLSEHIKIVDIKNGGRVIVIKGAKQYKKWIHIRGTLYMCPNCKKRFNFEPRIFPWKCCPICEQKMNGVKEQDHE